MKKMSPLWMINRDIFVGYVDKANSISDVLKKLNLTGGGSYNTIRKILDHHKIDYSRFPKGQGHNKGKKFNKPMTPLSEVLIKGSQYCRHNLKKRIKNDGLLKWECAICGNKGEWNNKPLTLILDHINGINNDCQIENLRFVCPNCNSQLDTHCRGYKIKHCVNCGVSMIGQNKHCDRCIEMGVYRIGPKRRMVRPSYEELLRDIKETNYCATGRKYGVSDNCIRKWIKAYKKAG